MGVASPLTRFLNEAVDRRGQNLDHGHLPHGQRQDNRDAVGQRHGATRGPAEHDQEDGDSDNRQQREHGERRDIHWASWRFGRDD